MAKGGKELHDELRASLPGTACVDNCPYCKKPETAASEGEGHVSDTKIYDQATVDALVANAKKQASDEAKAEQAERVSQLEADLAAKTTEFDTVKASLDAANTKVTELETSIADREAEDALKVKGEERAAKVKEAVPDITDEKIAERQPQWAAMTDEAFDAVLADMQMAVETASAKGGDGKPPKSKVLDGPRETAGNKDTDAKRLEEFFSLASA